MQNMNPEKPAYGLSVGGENSSADPEEGSGDSDCDEDYSSIQRPAFLVEGEPNFDLGPPDDGLEYLRRVRYYFVSLNILLIGFFSLPSFAFFVVVLIYFKYVLEV